MQHLKVFVPEPEEPESLDILREIAEVKAGEAGRSYSKEDLAREMTDADVVIITSKYQITKDLIARAPKLRAIVKYGSKPGLDNVDMSAATARRILVSYTPGANSDSVAEFTVALALSLAKKLHNIMRLVKSNEWRNASCLGLELGEKTVGLVGLGVIGSKVASKLSCLGMKILATDPYVSTEKADLVHAKLTDLHTLLRNSDVITLHAQVTDETRHMIGKHEFALVKPTAYFINTARGALVDEKALYEALRDGKIAGAAIDVFETEPPIGSLLLSLENVILTPHVASWTADALRKEALMAAEETRRILTGTRPMNLANPEVLD